MAKKQSEMVGLMLHMCISHNSPLLGSEAKLSLLAQVSSGMLSVGFKFKVVRCKINHVRLCKKQRFKLDLLLAALCMVLFPKQELSNEKYVALVISWSRSGKSSVARLYIEMCSDVQSEIYLIVLSSTNLHIRTW